MSAGSLDFRLLLDEAAAFHGHLCGGQIVGVRMALAGLRGIGLKYPEAKENRDFIVFMEIGRCAADAIMTVTGRRVGRRTMKVLDYGKTAATFLDLNTGKAVRVAVRADFRLRAGKLAEERFARLDEEAAQLEALKLLPEEELLSIREVTVAVPAEDLPGIPRNTAVCEQCGEAVLDCREVVENGRVLCRPCRQGRDYYTPLM